MAHADTIPSEAALSIARQIGERLPGVVPPGLAAVKPGMGAELGETFSVWTLKSVEDKTLGFSDEDLPHIAMRTGYWHHQIRCGRQAKAFAWSVNSTPSGAKEWTVTQVAASDIARWIDEAIDWIDRHASGDPLVRLIVMPEYHLHTFWLEEDGHNHFLIVDMPPTFKKLKRRTLYSTEDFLRLLYQEPQAQGIPAQRLTSR